MLAAAIACAPLLVAADASAATTWTQIPSGTRQDITAVEYRRDSQAWLATAGGQILTADPTGAFVVRESDPAQRFTDLAFNPAGTHGLATTATGQVYRSDDAGATWGWVPLPHVHRSCAPAALRTPLPRLDGIFWANDTTAYLVGGASGTQPVVLRSTNSGTTFADHANWEDGVGCRFGATGRAVTDGFAAPSDPNSLRFITDDFGTTYTTNDGLVTATRSTGMTIDTGGVPRLAVDPAAPDRIWAVNRDTNANFHWADATSGGRRAVTVMGAPEPLVRSLYDVDYAGGTLIAVGSDGEIFRSLDGKTAYLARASGLDRVDWRAVSIADAGTALVGGAGGALVKTTNANALPDTGTPTPPGGGGGGGGPVPGDPSPRRPSGRRAGGGGADTPPNVSGRPATTTTGGATIALWKKVALSKGRFVPVRISARSPRRFVIEIRRAKRPRTRIAMSKARLRKGKKLVKVPLRASTKTGKYLIVVRVYKGRRAIGKRVRTAFVIVR